MRVLVTGADGYIGTVLGPRLVERRFDVVGVNCGFYRGGWLYNDDRPRPLTITKDRRGRSRTQRAIDAQSAAYARCKVLVERDVGALTYMNFSVFLRNATAFWRQPAHAVRHYPQ